MIWANLKKIYENVIYEKSHFSFLYYSSVANVIVFSILFVKHPNKHNNQQFNVKAILKKEKIPIHVKLGVTWYTYTDLIME